MSNIYPKSGNSYYDADSPKKTFEQLRVDEYTVLY